MGSFAPPDLEQQSALRCSLFTFLPNKLGKSRTLFSPMRESKSSGAGVRVRDLSSFVKFHVLLGSRATSCGNKAALLFVCPSKSRTRIFLYPRGGFRGGLTQFEYIRARKLDQIYFFAKCILLSISFSFFFFFFFFYLCRRQRDYASVRFCTCPHRFLV